MSSKGGLQVPDGYRQLDTESLPAYLSLDQRCASVLGGTAADWEVREVGDGNLNLVFIVRGPAGGLAVKQALPYLRLVGEAWPLPLERAHFEHLALQSQMRHTPGLVPEVIRYDGALYCIVMEYLTPHVIMRKGMIAGTEYPRFAEDISDFMARNLFLTSDLAASSRDKRAGVAEFSRNTELCAITEDVIFTEPYTQAENNRWTTPQLDGYAARFRDDSEVKAAICRLKGLFMSSTEALLHGDLHTGSVMVTEEDTRVIDPEFAFYGPMAFDTGKILANLLISFYSQAGHETETGGRDSYRRWILDTLVATWDKFEAKFLALWRDPARATGNGYPEALFAGDEGARAMENVRAERMRRLWRDTVAFCGAFFVRRILGIAHNIDLEQIEDAHTRALCEARALEMAMRLMRDPGAIRGPDALAALAQELDGVDFELTA